MAKDFIRDDGKVRNCDSNIAKMNILEFMRFTGKDTAIRALDCIAEQAVMVGQGLFYLTANILLIITTPINFPIVAYFRIKKSKKAVREEGK